MILGYDRIRTGRKATSTPGSICTYRVLCFSRHSPMVPIPTRLAYDARAAIGPISPVGEEAMISRASQTTMWKDPGVQSPGAIFWDFGPMLTPWSCPVLPFGALSRQPACLRSTWGSSSNHTTTTLPTYGRFRAAVSQPIVQWFPGVKRINQPPRPS
jgi:hypothetical protein